MPDTTYVRVEHLATGIVDTPEGAVVELQIGTPSGDHRRLLLTPLQADELATALVGVSCDLQQ